MQERLVEVNGKVYLESVDDDYFQPIRRRRFFPIGPASRCRFLIEVGYEVRYVPGKGYQAHCRNGNPLWLPIPIDKPMDEIIDKSLSREEPVPPPKVNKPRYNKKYGWHARVPEYRYGRWFWNDIYFNEEEEAIEWWKNYRKE